MGSTIIFKQIIPLIYKHLQIVHSTQLGNYSLTHSQFLHVIDGLLDY